MVKNLILVPALGAVLAFAGPGDCRADWFHHHTASPTPIICSTAALLTHGVSSRIKAGREFASRACLNRRRSNLDAQREWLNRQVALYNATVANYYARYHVEPLFSSPNFGTGPIIQEPNGPYLPPPPSGDPESWESEERSVLVD